MFFHVKASSGLLGMMVFMCTDIACIGMHTMVGMARVIFKAHFYIQVWALSLLLLLLLVLETLVQQASYIMQYPWTKHLFVHNNNMAAS